MARIPIGLKVGWTAWTLLWGWTYALYHGPQSFLWFCNLGALVIAVGLWSESRLFLSWQAVSVLLVQLLYTFDVVVRFCFGRFPIGATGFMFDPAHPLGVRILSLCMHLGTPPVLIYGLARLGYHRAALPLQVATTAVLLPVSYLFGPARNLNWSWGPLFRTQDVVAPPLYVAVAVIGYAILLYIPSHVFFTRVWPRDAGIRAT